jgi:hypothetical protein
LPVRELGLKGLYHTTCHDQRERHMFWLNTRKQDERVRGYIGRLVNLTSPNLPPTEGESRHANRCNRTIPALLVPWNRGAPSPSEAVYVLTKDFSDLGIGVTLHQPFRDEEVVLAFLVDGEATFFEGQARQLSPFGGGFWQLGIILKRMVQESDCPALHNLLPYAAKLAPYEHATLRA